MHRLLFPYYHCSSQQSLLHSYLLQKRKLLPLLLLLLSRDISKTLQLQSTSSSFSLHTLFFCGVCNTIFLLLATQNFCSGGHCSELLLFPIIHSHHLLQVQIPLAFGVALIHGFCWSPFLLLVVFFFKLCFPSKPHLQTGALSL